MRLLECLMAAFVGFAVVWVVYFFVLYPLWLQLKYRFRLFKRGW
jgi:hypothetical protein